METLRLFENELTCLDKNLFDKLRNLRELDLYFNNLMTLDARLLFNCIALTTLKLGSNKLEYLDKDKFLRSKQLEEINISRNKIKTINMRQFCNFNKLSSLSIQKEVVLDNGNSKYINYLKNKKVFVNLY